MEILPGMTVPVISEISDQMRKAGAIGLMAGVGTPRNTTEDVAQSVAQIIAHGALSSQNRLEAGMMKLGASSMLDLASGGGDQVFTRLVTNALIDIPIDEFSSLSGNMQMLYDLDVVNYGAYGYREDRFGVKNPLCGYNYKFYENRDNLIQLTKEIDQTDSYNEVMIKNRIPPSAIRGVVVENEKAKAILINTLMESGLINFVSGRHMICGKDVDDFIHVGSRFDRKSWDKPQML
jgi:hypothetical protein